MHGNRDNISEKCSQPNLEKITKKTLPFFLNTVLRSFDATRAVDSLTPPLFSLISGMFCEFTLKMD